jgi:hypothetical protein
MSLGGPHAGIAAVPLCVVRLHTGFLKNCIYANVVHGHPPKFLLLILTHIDLLLLSMYKELFGRYTIWVT